MMTLEEFWNSPEVLAAAERAKAKMEKDHLDAVRSFKRAFKALEEGRTLRVLDLPKETSNSFKADIPRR